MKLHEFYKESMKILIHFVRKKKGNRRENIAFKEKEIKL
jgi:hypothetical protein